MSENDKLLSRGARHGLLPEDEEEYNAAPLLEPHPEAPPQWPLQVWLGVYTVFVLAQLYTAAWTHSTAVLSEAVDGCGDAIYLAVAALFQTRTRVRGSSARRPLSRARPARRSRTARQAGEPHRGRRQCTARRSRILWRQAVPAGRRFV